MTSTVSSDHETRMPRAELVMLLVLTMVQFTGIMDMIIVAPLELPLTRAFHENAAWFANSIFAFTLSSCAFGLAGASFIDRFDRKYALLILYAGFGLGQFACALSSSATSFMLARVFTGAFAGVMSASASAIIGDVVPIQRRGTASGIMNSAYALAFIIGVPLGLYLANHFSWHAPFFLMSAQTALVVVTGLFTIPSVRSHLAMKASATGGTPIRSILKDTKQLRALGLNGGLMFSAYAITPFLATYMVSNLHFSEGSIPTFYLVGGLFTLAAGVWFGLLADKHGATRVFSLITLASIAPTIWITQLETHSLALAIGVTTIFMATVTGRTVPALAMALTSVPAELRGGFMSLNSAFQQLCLGLGAVAAGSVLVERDHVLYRFGWCGAIAAVASVVCVLLSIGLKDRPEEVKVAESEPVKAAVG